MAQVIPESWQVPAKFRQRVGASAGRQRAMIDSGHLLLILHELPGLNQMERSARLFWRAPDGSWKASGAREGSGLPVLKRHLEAFQAAIVKFDEALDEAVKGAVRPEPFFDVITRATPLQRTTRNLHKALQAARDGVDDKEIITLRDLASDLERAADNIVTDAHNGMAFSIARNTETQTWQATRALRAQHRLNLLAAVFFPVTAIGTIFGTQMTTGLEGAGPWLFWAVVGVAFATGLIIRSAIKDE